MPRSFLLILLMTCCSQWLMAQQTDSWTAFYNQDSSLTGFKDARGQVMLAPQFVQTTGTRFEHVVAVTKAVQDKRHSYYLFRSGKVTGQDSLYAFEGTYDCESEGFIRFTDRASGKTGLLNSRGEVVVPAVYDALDRVTNGMLAALQGATQTTDREHASWEGGNNLLIDTANHILLEHFEPKRVLDLDFYTLRITAVRGTDSLRQYFQAKDGRWYSFQVFERAFSAWLHHVFLKRLDRTQLAAHSFENITCWDSTQGWRSVPRKKFLHDYYQLLQTGLQALASAAQPYDIMIDGLNPYIFEPGKYPAYFNNCQEAKSWQYPVATLRLLHNPADGRGKYELDFLKTAEGYKLIGVSIF